MPLNHSVWLMKRNLILMMRKAPPQFILVCLLSLSMLAACATTKPSPALLGTAEAAIEQARSAGAEELAPVQLEAAEERLDEARQGMAAEEYALVPLLVEQSQINAELALVLSEAASLRRRTEALRDANRVLEADIEDSFGGGGR